MIEQRVYQVTLDKNEAEQLVAAVGAVVALMTGNKPDVELMLIQIMPNESQKSFLKKAKALMNQLLEDQKLERI